MRYVTAVEAEQLVKEGKGDQLNGGNWVGNTIAYPSMIMGDHSRKVCDGYIMHPNKVKKAKGKTVSKRYKMVVSEAKIGRIVDSEVMKIKKILSKFLPRIDDKVTKIKLTEAIKQSDTLSKGKIVKDKQVVALMRYYELIKELHNVTA